MGIFRKFMYVGVVIVMVSMLSGVASADYPGAVTVDSCSTNGELFSASGTFSDCDGVIDVSIFVNSINSGCGATFYPPMHNGSWSTSNCAVPFSEQFKCLSVTVRITDVNGDTTTSAPCYAGVPERCWDGKENDCDGKTDCDDSDCNEQVCNREDYPYHWYCCGGSCVDINTDPNNCGACGNACGVNAHCSGGACQCDDGYHNCDGDWSNGCECPPDMWCEEGECVPEASTLVLFAVGLLCLGGYIRLKKRKTK